MGPRLVIQACAARSRTRSSTRCAAASGGHCACVGRGDWERPQASTSISDVAASEATRCRVRWWSLMANKRAMEHCGAAPCDAVTAGSGNCAQRTVRNARNLVAACPGVGRQALTTASQRLRSPIWRPLVRHGLKRSCRQIRSPQACCQLAILIDARMSAGFRLSTMPCTGG